MWWAGDAIGVKMVTTNTQIAYNVLVTCGVQCQPFVIR